MEKPFGMSTLFLEKLLIPGFIGVGGFCEGIRDRNVHSLFYQQVSQSYDPSACGQPSEAPPGTVLGLYGGIELEALRRARPTITRASRVEVVLSTFGLRASIDIGLCVMRFPTGLCFRGFSTRFASRDSGSEFPLNS